MSATAAAGHGPGGHAADQAIAWIRRLLLEGVLDLVAGLLDVALGLVGLAFRFQLVVAGRAADAFLDITLDLGGLVGRLVLSRHDMGPSGWVRLANCPYPSRAKLAGREKKARRLGG